MRKQLLIVLCIAIFYGCGSKPEAAAETAPAAAATETTKPGPAEFADPKYADVGKKGLALLTSGDVDGWVASYADNAVYAWNNGDSLAGKAAISEYWKKRRSEVIETMSFSEDIWLPVKVNQPQRSEAPGVWLLGWYKVDTKYKTGKSMSQWIHTLMHFNSEDKIDRVLQFLDRAPINAAMKK